MAKACFHKSGLTASFVRIRIGVVEAMIAGMGTNVFTFNGGDGGAQIESASSISLVSHSD